MQFRGVALGVLVCVAGLNSVARADDKKEIDALYNKVQKAMIAKDLKTIMASGTKDFTYTEAGKTMSGEQISSQMQQQFSMTVGTPKSKFTITSCVVKGKTASVECSNFTEMQIKLGDSKPHTLVSNSKEKDSLVKTDKGWLMKAVNVTSDKMTLDGKPFDPSKPPPAGK